MRKPLIMCYREGVTAGITDVTYTVTIFGEKVIAYYDEGIFKTAYGNHVLSLKDFGY